MTVPRFYVIARVVGSLKAYDKWVERLISLCEVSATEPHSSSYYWGRDLDGEPDTIWGLEGYSHAVGFFMGHPASDIFKREMELVDSDKLLKHTQGLGSPDYDLHHYDWFGGYLTLDNDPEKDSKTSHVVVHHFFAKEGKRDDLLQGLVAYAEKTKENQEKKGPVQSCAVLKECNDISLVTLWVRTRTSEDFRALVASDLYNKVMTEELKPDGKIVAKTELHNSQAFNGFIDKKPVYEM